MHWSYGRNQKIAVPCFPIPSCIIAGANTRAADKVARWRRNLNFVVNANPKNITHDRCLELIYKKPIFSPTSQYPTEHYINNAARPKTPAIGTAVLKAPPVDEDEEPEPEPLPVCWAEPIVEDMELETVRLAAALADLRVWSMKFAQATAAVMCQFWCAQVVPPCLVFGGLNSPPVESRITMLPFPKNASLLGSTET